MKILVRYVALSLLALALVSTGPTGAYAQSNALPPEMIGVTWDLVEIDRGTQGTQDATGKGLTLVFMDGSKVGGRGGCNGFGGDYSSGAGGSLTIRDLIQTLIACEQPIMDLEMSYFGALMGVTSYTLSGNTLELAFADDSRPGTLRFAKGAAQPPMPSDPPQTPGMPRTGEGGIYLTLAIVTAGAIVAGAMLRRYARRPAD